jgi:hypothetical protein
MGRYEPAFVELRHAAASNRKYFPNLLDLAWGLTGDAGQTEAFLDLHSDDDRLVFARFLARKGRGVEVVDEIRLLDTRLSDENRDELIRLLNVSRSSDRIVGLLTETKKVEQVLNGGFEDAVYTSGSPSGWIASRVRTNLTLAFDVSEKLSGERSMQVSFAGDWDAGEALLSQTIILKRDVAYRLTFAVKTKDLVTGGPPRIVLTDATSEQILAKSDPFPSPSASWQTLSVDFKPQSETVVISLRRDNCNSTPCPIFGTAWLDDFSLQKLFAQKLITPKAFTNARVHTPRIADTTETNSVGVGQLFQSCVFPRPDFPQGMNPGLQLANAFGVQASKTHFTRLFVQRRSRCATPLPIANT